MPFAAPLATVAVPCAAPLTTVAVPSAVALTGPASAGSANAAISMAGGRLAALLACNLALVLAASLLLTGRADFQLGAGCFFALLITLIIWLYGAYKPLHDARF